MEVLIAELLPLGSKNYMYIRQRAVAVALQKRGIGQKFILPKASAV
jgi:hypothetical protein